MALNIGLNVIEVDGSAPATITGAATSVGAFNIATLRGPINSPVQVTSFAQFAERFGSFDPNGLGAYLVKGFFDNGGQRAYVNRVAGAGNDGSKQGGAISNNGTPARRDRPAFTNSQP